MENFLLFVSAFTLGWALGGIYFHFKMFKSVKIVLDNINKLENLNDNETDPIHIYFIESVGDSNYYLYHKDDHFVRQAKSIDELASDLYNLDKIEFARVQFNDRLFQFEKGIVTEFSDLTK